jgi:hypothetical protein
VGYLCTISNASTGDADRGGYSRLFVRSRCRTLCSGPHLSGRGVYLAWAGEGVEDVGLLIAAKMRRRISTLALKASGLLSVLLENLVVSKGTVCFPLRSHVKAYQMAKPRTHPTSKIGAQFGRLTVLSRATPGSAGQARFKVRCVCGTDTTVTEQRLRSGHGESCSCPRRERRIA